MGSTTFVVVDGARYVRDAGSEVIAYCPRQHDSARTNAVEDECFRRQEAVRRRSTNALLPRYLAGPGEQQYLTQAAPGFVEKRFATWRGGGAK